MVASLLETIVVTNLCHSAHKFPVPHWVHVFVLQLLGCLVCLYPRAPGVEDTIIENPAAEGETFTQAGFFWVVTENSCPISPLSSFSLQQNQKCPLWWAPVRVRNSWDHWMMRRPCRS